MLRGELSVLDVNKVVDVVASSPLVGNSFSKEGGGSDDLVVVFVNLIGIGDNPSSEGFISGFVTIEC